MDYMLARHYGDSLPRFLSPDPIGGSAARPQSWNRYAYVLGNPMRLVDPNGMYGINPNPYNPGGSNPCDGRGPMCFKVEDGTQNEQKKVKAALEETRKSLTPETKQYFEHFYGADIDEIFTDGQGPTLKLEHKGTNTRTPRGEYDPRANTAYLNLDYFEYGEDNQLFDNEGAGRTALHEAEHYANDAASWWGDKNPAIDVRLQGRILSAVGRDRYWDHGPYGWAAVLIQFGRIW